MLNRLRKTLIAAGLFAGAVFAGGVSFGAITSVPSTPQFNEPSQLVATLNALIQMLNGLPNPITVTAPTTVMGVGTFCTNTAGGSPQTCNGQRGAALFTGITVAATGTTQNIVVTNSFITAGSNCNVQPNTAFTAGSGVIVATAVPAAGTLTLTLVNAGTTANAVTTGTFGFNCFN
jgi:hypothetical protein